MITPSSSSSPDPDLPGSNPAPPADNVIGSQQNSSRDAIRPPTADLPPITWTKVPRKPNYLAYGCGGIVLLIVGYVVTMGVLHAYRAACQARYKQQIQQIVLALWNYEQQHGSFPPAYTVNSDGQRLHSWRTLMLPWLGEEALFQQIHLNEPWDSPHNKQFHNRRPEIFGHTYVKDSVPGEAHILAIVGPETIWPEQYSAKVNQVTDGTSNTLSLMEYSGNEINWMEPRDLSREDIRTKVFPVGDIKSTGAFGAVRVAMADGAVRAVSPTIDRKDLYGLCSINAGIRLPGVDWPTLPIDSPADLPAPKPATGYPGSLVSPHLSAKIDGSKNVVYCATFQIAWDQLRGLAKGAPQFTSASEAVDHLNAGSFPLSDLDPSSYSSWRRPIE